LKIIIANRKKTCYNVYSKNYLYKMGVIRLFEKHKLKKEIAKCRERITDIEKKRYRSQGELVNAILNNAQPNTQEVEYFNRYTMEINETRDRMHRYEEELEGLKKK